MRIAIDVDDVLADFIDSFIEFYNTEYKADYKLEDFRSFAFWEVIGGTPENAYEVVDRFNRSEYFDDMKPVKHSEESVEQLKRDNELIVITSRVDHIQKKTEDWLQRHFPDSFSEIIFSNNVHRENGKAHKADICKKMDVDILIDDCLENVMRCNEDCMVILFDRPWNQVDDESKLPRNIYRVFDWNEAVELIRKKKG